MSKKMSRQEEMTKQMCRNMLRQEEMIQKILKLLTTKFSEPSYMYVFITFDQAIIYDSRD